MAAAAVDLEYTYRYRGESALTADVGRTRLSLVTTSQPDCDPLFLHGNILSPKRTGDLLIAVADVVQSRFHIPAAMLAKILRQSDPVITCSDEQCRFEGFSACCGAYVRLDLLANAIDGERLDRGTTNVNFNAPMRTALSRVRDGEPMEVKIGAGAIEVESRGESIVERKVTLPSRWLRGFADVQASQARMRPAFELSGAEFRRFLRELPQGVKGEAWLSYVGGGVRISTRSSPGAIGAGGISRLRVLDTASRHVDRVRVYGSMEGDGLETAWELSTPDSRLTLALSPEVWRGFSGEGQLLDSLAETEDPKAMAAVKASLRWQEHIDVDELVVNYGLDRDRVERELARLAASGLVGYDLHHGTYFHRELPFRSEAIPKLQPRLAGARKLVDGDSVTFETLPQPSPWKEEGDKEPVKAWVRSGDVEYRVIIDGDNARCTCVWFAKHGGSRGPCKHILAVNMALERGDNAD